MQGGRNRLLEMSIVAHFMKVGRNSSTSIYNFFAVARQSWDNASEAGTNCSVHVNKKWKIQAWKSGHMRGEDKCS